MPARPWPDNIVSMTCYTQLIFPIMFLLIKPYRLNKKIRFHAFQSIFFSVFPIGLLIITVILGIGLSIITGNHVLLLLTIRYAGMPFLLGYYILWLFLMRSAYYDKKIVLPFVGPLAEKLA